MTKYKLSISLCISFLFTANSTFAGAPFYTDDPEPAAHKHIEVYIASIHEIEKKEQSGNLFNIETNYGLIPNMQIHLLLPVVYRKTETDAFHAGYADSEFGIKYRFIQETDNCPQIATYPTLTIPTIRNTNLSDGNLKFYLPLWMQKSWGKLSSYAGGGYWFNSGEGNKNYTFLGWQAQYSFTPKLMLGTEIYYHSTDVVDGTSLTAFNIGGSLNFTEQAHLLFAAGHSLTNENITTAYLGFLWTP